MSWKYNGEDFIKITNKMEGFVYIITNLTNNKKYIGKKHFWTRQKDRKTGRRKTQESDWKIYPSSCDLLKEDIKNLGEDKFLKEILHLCPHKKSMSYYETMEQFKRNVIFRDDYYNTNVEGKFFSGEVERLYNLVEHYDKYKCL